MLLDVKKTQANKINEQTTPSGQSSCIRPNKLVLYSNHATRLAGGAGASPQPHVLLKLKQAEVQIGNLKDI